jgi:tRNA (cytosine40_48-C5)-methyltransferase
MDRELSTRKFFLDRYERLGWKFSEPKIRECIRAFPDAVDSLRKRGCVIERVPFLKSGYWVSCDFALGTSVEHLAGMFYIQEAASQLPVIVLDPKKNDVVLDACASPGSKTTQLSEVMHGEGTIVAFESKQSRMFRLLNNLDRMGTRNVVCFCADLRKAAGFGFKFDKILLDAPCSGNFASDLNWFKKRNYKGILKCADVQKQLLASAFNLLNEGGVLVYSTCSLEPEENELNVDWFLRNYSVKLSTTNLTIGVQGVTNVFGKRINRSVSLCRRIWPGQSQGFFVARFVK